MVLLPTFCPYSAECVEGLFLFAPVNKALLIYLPELRNCIGPKPHRYVGWCHGFLNHTDQFVVEGLQIRLVPELRGEGFEGLPGVVLAAVEAAVDKGLYAAS